MTGSGSISKINLEDEDATVENFRLDLSRDEKGSVSKIGLTGSASTSKINLEDEDATVENFRLDLSRDEKNNVSEIRLAEHPATSNTEGDVTTLLPSSEELLAGSTESYFESHPKTKNIMSLPLRRALHVHSPRGHRDTQTMKADNRSPVTSTTATPPHTYENAGDELKQYEN